MKKAIVIMLAFMPLWIMAQNPIVQTHFTADPAPMVYHDTLFLYVGCDKKEAPRNGYLMREYRLYYTTDMVNWTDCGAPLETSKFDWSCGDASAAQCVERNGKFYWYISSQNKYKPGSSVGVAVGESPYGPFRDALGEGLVTNDMTTYAKHSWDDLDPTVYIDGDSQAYLYWGNGVCYFTRLNSDMLSLASPIQAIDAKDKDSFGGQFTEAPWLYWRNGYYYLIYASKFPECICYSMSANATGPWKYKGVLMPTEKGSNTNHPGVVDYKGNSYFFYHNDALPGGHSYCRSVCVEQFVYNTDGTMPMLHMTDQGIQKGVGTLDPYTRVEAETMAWSEGVATESRSVRDVYVTEIHDGDYIKVRDVDFGDNGARKFIAAVSDAIQESEIEIRLDAKDGQLVGVLTVQAGAASSAWREISSKVKRTRGVHDIYLKFKGGDGELFDFDYWLFQ